MYQALYRKWRPMVFSDVIGQRHVTDTLKKQIETGRLSHAYLFTGTRGTGKTTCAKILAKAANCLDPRGGEPCNECPSCVGINNESITDISEIDAATYTGVDNIRQIRDETAYVPSATRMRVYIIDECHMLSPSACNALLKTLEEPPPHVLFILATTEPQKVLPTILSRCQIFSFKRIRAEEIGMRLLEVAASEGLRLEEPAAALLSRLADGALRDAISMLDQCAASAEGPVGTEQVLSVLGLMGSIKTMSLAKALVRRDAGAALEVLDEAYSGGKDVFAFLGELSSLLRDILVLKTTKSFDLLTGNYDREEIGSIDIERSRLISMILMIRDALSRMQRSENRRVDAELCLISMCDDTLSGGIEGLAARVERLEKGEGMGKRYSGNAGKTDTTAAAEGQKKYPDIPTGIKSNIPTGKTADTPTDIELNIPAGKTADTPMDAYWKEILEAVRPHVSLPQYSYLCTIKVPVLQGPRLRIVTGSEVAQNLLDKRELLEAVDRTASAILGRDIKSDVIPAERFASENKHAAGTDKLNKLIERGSRLNNITLE